MSRIEHELSDADGRESIVRLVPNLGRCRPSSSFCISSHILHFFPAAIRDRFLRNTLP